jgi:hypothetical protein
MSAAASIASAVHSREEAGHHHEDHSNIHSHTGSGLEASHSGSSSERHDSRPHDHHDHHDHHLQSRSADIADLTHFGNHLALHSHPGHRDSHTGSHGVHSSPVSSGVAHQGSIRRFTHSSHDYSSPVAYESVPNGEAGQHSGSSGLELVPLTNENLKNSGRQGSFFKPRAAAASASSQVSSKRRRARQVIGVDILDSFGHKLQNENKDNDSDSESSDDGVLVGAADDDDDEDAPVMPWIVPEFYSIALPSGQQRKFELDWMQRIFVMMTDTQSW